MLDIEIKTTRVCLLVFHLFLTGLTLNAQFPSTTESPVIGQPCPDITFDKLLYYSKRHANLKDFTGKWLVLDFWNAHCGSCISSMPKIDSLNKAFSGKMQFILVGYTGSQYTKKSDMQTITRMYTRLQKKWNLNIPIYFDSVLFTRFSITGCPFIVVLDDKGIVRTITNTLQAKEILALLNDKEVNIPLASNSYQQAEQWKPVDLNHPFLLNNNGGRDTQYLFRTLLTNYNVDIPRFNAGYFFPFPEPNRVLFIGVSVLELYDIAYRDTMFNIPLRFKLNSYGRYWTTPILQMKDTSIFMSNTNSGVNLYCYSLEVPRNRANTVYMQKIMQKDLEMYFGYRGEIEKRQMPYWKLENVSFEKKNIDSSASEAPEEIEGDGLTGIVLRHSPVSSLINIIWGRNSSEPPFVDETGIKASVNITLDCDLTNFESLKTALKQNGLNLVRGTREMMVIVIK
jgi:thiol-disulfide isomerase/thioredoxin